MELAVADLARTVHIHRLPQQLRRSEPFIATCSLSHVHRHNPQQKRNCNCSATARPQSHATGERAAESGADAPAPNRRVTAQCSADRPRRDVYAPKLPPKVLLLHRLSHGGRAGGGCVLQHGTCLAVGLVMLDPQVLEPLRKLYGTDLAAVVAVDHVEQLRCGCARRAVQGCAACAFSVTTLRGWLGQSDGIESRWLTVEARRELQPQPTRGKAKTRKPIPGSRGRTRSRRKRRQHAEDDAETAALA